MYVCMHMGIYEDTKAAHEEGEDQAHGHGHHDHLCMHMKRHHDGMVWNETHVQFDFFYKPL